MTSRTVLIVDDEENLTEAIKYNLEQEGFQVSTAADGERGLAMAREFDPGPDNPGHHAAHRGRVGGVQNPPTPKRRSHPHAHGQG